MLGEVHHLWCVRRQKASLNMRYTSQTEGNNMLDWCSTSIIGGINVIMVHHIGNGREQHVLSQLERTVNASPLKQQGATGFCRIQPYIDTFKQLKQSCFAIGLKDNPVYDSSGPLPDPSTKEGATGDAYATVVKPKKNDAQEEDSSKLYAHVDKTHEGKNKGKVKEKHGKVPREDIYENATLAGRDNQKGKMNANSGDLKTDENVYENPNEASKGSMNSHSKKDGLMYADVMLDSPTTKNGKYVIRGLDNRTEYADISFDKRGEPLPDNNEEQM